MTVLIDHVAAASPGVEIDPAAWAGLFEDMFAEPVAPVRAENLVLVMRPGDIR